MNIQKMMQQAQQMQQKITALQSQLEAMEVDGSAGSGMVTVRLNGKNHMLKIHIDSSLMKVDEKDMLEDLILAAYNDARQKVDTASSEQMNALTKGLNLPPGMKLPF
jgi:nucleoid-associated protein EbfC